MISKVKSYAKKILKGLFKLDLILDHFIIDSLDENPIIVDLGAGTGAFSDIVLRRYCSCKIILVEPSPSLFMQLALKFKDKNIELLNAAIGSKIKNNEKFYLSMNY